MCSPVASSSVRALPVRHDARSTSTVTMNTRRSGRLGGTLVGMHLLTDAASPGPRGYSEHLRVPDLSVGSVVLAAGAVDGQQPHTEDEVYVVLSGRGRLWTPDLTVDVTAGSVAFVPALEPHRFVDVTEDLHVLVVFGPAEHSRS